MCTICVCVFERKRVSGCAAVFFACGVRDSVCACVCVLVGLVCCVYYLCVFV